MFTHVYFHLLLHHGYFRTIACNYVTECNELEISGNDRQRIISIL